MALPFRIQREQLPRTADNWRECRAFADWHDKLKQRRLQEPESFKNLVEFVTGEQAGLFAGIFCYSPYLTLCLDHHMAFAEKLLEVGPEEAIAILFHKLEEEIGLLIRREEVARSLRDIKQKAALTIALADIAGHWDDREVVLQLSLLAEKSVRAALAFLLRNLHQKKQLRLPFPDSPSRDCGYCVLALGKLGAWELNYSSDIDLIVIFDPAKADYRHSRGPKEGYVKLTRDLVKLLNDRTKDGYVFRTDLRLRPDPGATAIALSYNAAIGYYESQGLNWERAAMIKARPLAGDLALGESFLTEIKSFIWRKHLDFIAIKEIYNIKQRINYHRGGRSISVAGHDIKLGRGGIREIEFFVQTQQLIWGGRKPRLRLSQSHEALEALTEAGLISAKTCQEMQQSYWFLRRVENRLQMMDDHQRQTLPESPEKLADFARFLGFPSAEAFYRKAEKTLRLVGRHHDKLFQSGSEKENSAGQISLSFAEPDLTPETMQSLRALGFEDPERSFSILKVWKNGRYRALRSSRARGLLTSLLPPILQAFQKSGYPDDALIQFDRFLIRLPTGVQLFTLLDANPILLSLIGEIMGLAPQLAEHLAEKPNLLEAVLTGDFFEPFPGAQHLSEDLDRLLETAHSYEEILDMTRQWARDYKFQAGIQILRNTASVTEISEGLTLLAEVVLKKLLPHVKADFAEKHGNLPGSHFAIVALGRLGSREMSPSSDLDLLCLFNPPPDINSTSDGRRPLNTIQYFSRLTLRITNAISALTAEGRLYEIDMRLRPSGLSGPLAVSLSAFKRYHTEESWTWEKMALTKARVILGPPDFQREIEKTIAEILCQGRDVQKLRDDVLDMRQRLYQEKPPQGDLDVKNAKGGIIDLEFLAQYLQLSHPVQMQKTFARPLETIFAAAAREKLLSLNEFQELENTILLFKGLQNLLHVSSSSAQKEGNTPPSLQELIVTLCKKRNLEEVRDQLRQKQENVARMFQDKTTRNGN